MPRQRNPTPGRCTVSTQAALALWLFEKRETADQARRASARRSVGDETRRLRARRKGVAAHSFFSAVAAACSSCSRFSSLGRLWTNSHLRLSSCACFFTSSQRSLASSRVQARRFAG